MPLHARPATTNYDKLTESTMKMFGIDVHNVCDSVKDDGLAGVRLSRLPLEILPEVNEGV